MSVKCPKCGFDLKDSLMQEVKLTLEKDYSGKTEKLIAEFNKKIEAREIENSKLQTMIRENSTILKEKIRQQLLSEFNNREIKLKTEKIELEGKLEDIKQNKKSEINFLLLKELQKQKRSLYSEFELKETEKNIEIDRLRKLIKNLDNKSEQGSQQMQGESAELYLEKTLKATFPMDDIREVPKGLNGADIFHHIKDRQGRKLGMIYIETKNTKKFSASWIVKLKEDMRKKKADFGILISVNLPSNIKDLEEEDLFICGFNDYLLAIKLLRSNIIELSKVKTVHTNRKHKKDLLYDYITGKEFAQWLRGILDYMKEQKEHLEYDKRLMQKSIAIREKQIEKIYSSHQILIGHFKGLGSKNDFSLLEDMDQEKLLE